MDTTNEPIRPFEPASMDALREWLNFIGLDLYVRRKELTEALGDGAAAIIRDDTMQAEAAENIRMVGAFRRKVDDIHKAEKAPYLEGGRVVDGWFRDFLDVLASAAKPVQRAMDDYAARQLAKRREEEAAERTRLADVQRKAEEAAAAAAEAGRDAEEEARRLERAAKDADRANRPTTASAGTRVRSDLGAVASARSRWRWMVADETLVPREFLTVDVGRVEAAIKAGARDPHTNRPLAAIPGIRYEEIVSAGVR